MRRHGLQPLARCFAQAPAGLSDASPGQRNVSRRRPRRAERELRVVESPAIALCSSRHGARRRAARCVAPPQMYDGQEIAVVKAARLLPS